MKRARGALAAQVVRQRVCVRACERRADVITFVTMSSCPVARLSSQMSERKEWLEGRRRREAKLEPRPTRRPRISKYIDT